MSSSDLQSLIRFLAQTAAIPLGQALGVAKPLQAASVSPDSLSTTSPKDIQVILGDADPDGKLSKQISNAAKRAQKKRGSGSTETSPLKKRKQNANTSAAGRAACEALPEPSTDVDCMKAKTVTTNRAPLLLAFAVMLLKYTHPEQPEDSRLSLSMAVVSAGAKARARDLGIGDGKKTSEVEEQGRGHRSLKVMGREVPVLRREKSPMSGDDENKTQETEDGDWFWGLDLDAMHESKYVTALPIHTAQSAHSYLAKAFSTANASEAAQSKAEEPSTKRKSVAKARSATDAEDRAANLSLVLGALDVLFSSWASTLDAGELDRRAWNWYASVRPAVEHGRRGWGEKGNAKLQEILNLRREAG